MNHLRTKLATAKAKTTPAMTKPEMLELAKQHKLIDVEKEKEYVSKNLLSKELKQIHDEEQYLKELLAGDSSSSSSSSSLGGSGKINDDGMDSNQINDILSKYKEYKGCIGSDQLNTVILPQVKPHTRICFVMNTDKSTQKGMHWLACLIDARPNGSHSIEYFNSLGSRGVEAMPKNFLKKIQPILQKLQTNTYMKVKQNAIADQNNTSSNCGEFAVKFIIDRMRNKGFAEATGWDKRGEANIEAWKKKQPEFKYIPAFFQK
jgi:hypothetical protein